ncbi:MAG: outer membrane beta-barrel protein [Bryobacterales bacterium]|nr:outer membrane beta-barrel protein [Bryobacterales bacterium]
MNLFFLLMLPAATLAEEALTPRERELLERIERLEQRLAGLEARIGASPAAQKPAEAPVGETAVPEVAPAGTTINVNLDAYYSYNFNRPVTGVNAVRAYDVSANGFAINQAGVIIERRPDAASGRRVGGRLDVMFGQAAETLQGSAANEPRPEVFRHVYQAYGTVVAPAGKGLSVDFGKWSSAFGIEGNYTKDQFNYSRSYWFSFLPFYHMGARVTYPVSRWLNASYWITNGVNQTEDFNSFKSQAVVMNFVPSSRLSGNLNYFNGQEQQAVNGQASRGRSHFLDGYLTWQASPGFTLAGEAVYAIERRTPDGAPRTVYGGAGYARYRIHPRFNLAGRVAYLNDRDGWFSGTGQALKDTTATATFDVADGFQMRWEVRRDWSNVAWFSSAEAAQRKQTQTTALVGLIWWFGGKQGPW